VNFHQFPGARQRPTPVTTFSSLLRILALVPGSQEDSLRKAQAELAARSIAGDHDLESALPVRRAKMGAAGQSLAMNGLASGANAQQKRQLDTDAEGEQVPQPKSRRLEYTTAQLTETGVPFFPGTLPLPPELVHTLWKDADQAMSAFLGLYKQMFELQQSHLSFQSAEGRKQAPARRRDHSHADVARRRRHAQACLTHPGPGAGRRHAGQRTGAQCT